MWCFQGRNNWYKLELSLSSHVIQEKEFGWDLKDGFRTDSDIQSKGHSLWSI